MPSRFQLPADAQARLSMLADMHRRVGCSNQNGSDKALLNAVHNTATDVAREVA